MPMKSLAQLGETIFSVESTVVTATICAFLVCTLISALFGSRAVLQRL